MTRCFTLLLFFLFYSLMSGAVTTFYKNDVVCRVTPDKDKVDEYKEKLCRLFEENQHKYPEQPAYGVHPIDCDIRSFLQINRFLPYVQQHNWCYPGSEEDRPYLFSDTLEQNEYQNSSMVVVRGRPQSTSNTLGFIRMSPGLQTNNYLAGPLSSTEFFWNHQTGYLRKALALPQALDRCRDDSTIISFFSFGLSDPVLKYIEELLSCGIRIDEMEINDMVFHYQDGESKLVNIYYDPASLSEKEVKDLGRVLAVSSKGGLSKSFSLRLKSNE